MTLDELVENVRAAAADHGFARLEEWQGAQRCSKHLVVVTPEPGALCRCCVLERECGPMPTPHVMESWELQRAKLWQRIATVTDAGRSQPHVQVMGDRVEIVVPLGGGKEFAIQSNPDGAEEVAHALLLAAASSRGLPISERERELVKHFVIRRVD
jgi:hypothetical protein